jgi:membrane associated rhomboid family serine protease
MSSGADLFVVCKQCGSEVSPYITECPYCGHRLRRRAPKLPRVGGPGGSVGGRGRRWRVKRRPRSVLADERPRRFAASLESRWAASPPYATVALVAGSCVVWVLVRGGYVDLNKLIVAGPLNGDWWKLFTSQFVYVNGLYAFVALVAIAIFGWLLERRHGPLLVLALFLAAGATGALVASAIYSHAVVSGGSAAALGLLAAWAIPDLWAARAGVDYDGDLLAVGAIAALLLAIPFALPRMVAVVALSKTVAVVVLPETSWLAGVGGGAVGLVIGLGLGRRAFAEQ